MLNAAGLSSKFWAEAIDIANFIRNRTLSWALERRGQVLIPEEKWTGQKQDISNFQPFRCICYTHIDKLLRKKPMDTAKKVCLVGYRAQNIFRVYDKNTKGFYIQRDVSFPKEYNYRMQEPE